MRAPLTAAPHHDLPDQLGTIEHDGEPVGMSLNELAASFLNHAVDSDFPERLAYEEREREADDEESALADDGFDEGELTGLLRNTQSLQRLIDEASDPQRSNNPRFRF